MELYAFTSPTNADGVSLLRVKSDHPVEMLPGFHRIMEELLDCNIVHAFTLIEKVEEKTAGEYFYSWYKVENYTCTVDKSAAVARTADKISETNNIAFVTLAENGNIDDVTSGEHAEVFSLWALGVNYKQGNIRRYGDNLYKCLQAHTSQEGWEPDVTPSLWKVIGDPTEEFPEWSQPVGAGDGYPKDSKVSHNSKHWVSTYDGENVWEPGVFGWEEVE